MTTLEICLQYLRDSKASPHAIRRPTAETLAATRTKLAAAFEIAEARAAYREMINRNKA